MVMQALYRPVRVKNELNRKADLLICWSVYVLTFTCGQRALSSDQKHKVVDISGSSGEWLSLALDIWKELGVELLLFGHRKGAS